jgi:hypothetical protein
MSRRNEITLIQLRYFAAAAEHRSMTEAARELFVALSLVAYDEATHSFCSVICSSTPAVAARCAHLADGAGAAHTRTSPTRASAPVSST